MRKTRPKNLNLFTIRFPLPAIISIAHRLTGVFLLALVPFLLWVLNFSLTEQGFDSLQQWNNNFLVKFIVWALLIPFYVHLIAGIRHLLMDIGMGDTLHGGRKSSLLVIAASIILVILTGIWLW